MSENFDPQKVKLSKYEKEFTEDGLWEKIGSVAKKAGKGVIKNALKLYYAMVLGKATPSQIAAIIGALGYLISPVDAIPDPLPGGLADDAGVLALVVSMLVCCSDPEVVKAAEEKIKEWFD